MLSPEYDLNSSCLGVLKGVEITNQMRIYSCMGRLKATDQKRLKHHASWDLEVEPEKQQYIQYLIQQLIEPSPKQDYFQASLVQFLPLFCARSNHFAFDLAFQRDSRRTEVADRGS